MFDKQKTLETVCTRISHDLIGNIGAVANAVELLEEGDLDFLDDIKAILKVSSQTLAARMKFFRMAFGLSNANLSDSAVVEKTIKDYLATIGNKNFPIIFQMGKVDIKFSRIMMLAVMILADLIVKGGQISAFEQEHKLFVNISEVSKVSAPKREEVSALLSGNEEEYLAQYAPVFCLKNLVDESDLNIRISDGDVFGFVIG